MKISEAIEEFDALVPNAVDAAVKVRWLSDLDLQVWREVLAPRHMGPECFRGYGQEPCMEQELLIPAGYTEVYRYYMESKLCGILHEDAGYNRAANQYNSVYQAYTDWVNRQRAMPRRFMRLV